MNVKNSQKEVSNPISIHSKIKPLIIFISYASKDSKIFQIPHMAKKLNEYPVIGNVLYWEQHMRDDIIKYMNDNVGKCDVLLLFCSPNSLKSEPVEMEWQAALKIKKKIIPIFINEMDIPIMLTTKLGIRFDKDDLDGSIEEIYQLILKKLAR